MADWSISRSLGNFVNKAIQTVSRTDLTNSGPNSVGVETGSQGKFNPYLMPGVQAVAGISAAAGSVSQGVIAATNEALGLSRNNSSFSATNAAIANLANNHSNAIQSIASKSFASGFINQIAPEVHRQASGYKGLDAHQMTAGLYQSMKANAELQQNITNAAYATAAAKLSQSLNPQSANSQTVAAQDKILDTFAKFSRGENVSNAELSQSLTNLNTDHLKMRMNEYVKNGIVDNSLNSVSFEPNRSGRSDQTLERGENLTQALSGIKKYIDQVANSNKDSNSMLANFVSKTAEKQLSAEEKKLDKEIATGRQNYVERNFEKGITEQQEKVTFIGKLEEAKVEGDFTKLSPEQLNLARELNQNMKQAGHDMQFLIHQNENGETNLLAGVKSGNQLHLTENIDKNGSINLVKAEVFQSVAELVNLEEQEGIDSLSNSYPEQDLVEEDPFEDDDNFGTFGG